MIKSVRARFDASTGAYGLALNIDADQESEGAVTLPIWYKNALNENLSSEDIINRYEVNVNSAKDFGLEIVLPKGFMFIGANDKAFDSLHLNELSDDDDGTSKNLMILDVTKGQRRPIELSLRVNNPDRTFSLNNESGYSAKFIKDNKIQYVKMHAEIDAQFKKELRLDRNELASSMTFIICRRMELR